MKNIDSNGLSHPRNLYKLTFKQMRRKMINRGVMLNYFRFLKAFNFKFEILVLICANDLWLRHGCALASLISETLTDFFFPDNTCVNILAITAFSSVVHATLLPLRLFPEKKKMVIKVEMLMYP